MTICRECATHVSLAVECKKCGQAYCHKHQRPDTHDCPALADSPTVPGRKESNGVSRRELLIGFLGVGIGGVSVAYTQGNGTVSGFIDNSSDDILNTPDPNAMEQELSDGFERLVWQEDGGAEIFFETTHGMDGFYIAHESDPSNKAIASCGTPRYGGSKTVPLLDLLRSDGYEYPSRRFKLIGGEGSFSGCSTWANVSNQALFGTTGTTYFTVPERFDL